MLGRFYREINGNLQYGLGNLIYCFTKILCIIPRSS
jgi:hypothetical protein